MQYLFSEKNFSEKRWSLVLVKQFPGSKGEVVLVFDAKSATDVVSRQAAGPVNRYHMPKTRSEPGVVNTNRCGPPCYEAELGFLGIFRIAMTQV